MLQRAFITILTAVVLHGGCTSDSPTSPDGGSNFSQTLSGTVDAFRATRHPLSITVSGNLTLRLTWGNSAVDLDLYLTAPSCTVSLYPMNSCGILAFSDGATGTSEVVTRSVTAGEEFQVWIDNVNPATAMNYALDIDVD